MTKTLNTLEVHHIVKNDFDVSLSLAQHVYDAADNFNKAMSSINVSEFRGNSQDSLHPFGKLLLSGAADEEFVSSGVNVTTGQTDNVLYEDGRFRFDVRIFMQEVNEYVFQFCKNILSHEMSIDTTVTETLVCLGPEEWKFLPLWAGGNDDDSGGVFQSDLPPAAPDTVSLRHLRRFSRLSFKASFTILRSLNFCAMENH